MAVAKDPDNPVKVMVPALLLIDGVFEIKSEPENKAADLIIAYWLPEKVILFIVVPKASASLAVTPPSLKINCATSNPSAGMFMVET